MSIGRGKTVEGVRVLPAMHPERIGAATVYYNGAPITNASGYGIDTQPYDDAIVMIDVGTFQGAAATLSVDVYESATDDPSAATLLAGAQFADVNEATDDTAYNGAIRTKMNKRYLFVRAETMGEPLTCDFSAMVALGRADSQSVGNTPVFDV